MLQSLRNIWDIPDLRKRVLFTLGLRRLHQVVEREDTPLVRGMIGKVPHLVAIVD